ncbi:MAG: AI-2E family transporter [Kineosporiaceae bacterium]
MEAKATPEQPAERSVSPWLDASSLRRAVGLVLIGVATYQVIAWGFGQLRSFLGLLFLAWMLSISIHPPVQALVRRGMRRGAATGVVMLALLVFTIGFFAAFGTLLVDQVAQLVRSLPNVVQGAVDWVNSTFQTRLRAQDIVASLDLTPDRMQQLIRSLTPSVVGIVSSVVGVVFQTFALLLFGYYMSAQEPALRDTVSGWFPPRQQQVISTVWSIAVDKTGGYVFSRLILALLSALATALFLAVLGVPFWLPLGIWTGLVSQFLPTIGTYLAIGLPALVALSVRPADALWVVVFGTAYQQLENYVLAPRITARTVDIHPAVALGSVIAGAALFGPLGALVSIPVVAAVAAVIQTYGHRYELVEDREPAEKVPTVRRRRRGRPRRSPDGPLPAGDSPAPADDHHR